MSEEDQMYVAALLEKYGDDFKVHTKKASWHTQRLFDKKWRSLS